MQAKVICLGVGGGALYYIALYLHGIGTQVIGYDIKKTLKTRDLEQKGIVVRYQNPNTKLENCDFVIYSDALPDELLIKLKSKNAHILFIEAGKFTNELIFAFEQQTLSPIERKAFLSSGIAPLFKLKLDAIKLIGVTGTDGKTTTTKMIYHALTELGYKPGMITTVGAKIGSKELDTGFHVTTPSQQDIYETVKIMQKQKCTHIILECTSQGLYMGRLAGIKFDVAVFTNITNEHLGYHKTWKRYAEAKSLLITKHLKALGKVIVNYDDKKTFNFLSKITKDTISYSIKNAVKNTEANLTATNLKENINEVTFCVSNATYKIPTIGFYNVSNALAAVGALKALGISEKASLQTLSTFEPAIGRMTILQKTPFTVIIDFAHTPNGLSVALKTASKLKKSSLNKLIIVFGCAAKRDEHKRPVMGALAKKYADTTILTAEDSRYESLKRINDAIAKGWNSLQTTKTKKLLRFDDVTKNVEVRRNAIAKALQLAQSGDVVLITGKGHENSLCFGSIEYPWNDINETKKLLSNIKPS